jgi:two-component system CheB/CheR fusion protein
MAVNALPPAASRYSDPLFLTMMNTLPAMIGHWDKNLRCSFGNAAYYKWFGKQPEEIIGMHLSELLGTAAFDFSRPYIDAALRGEPSVFERSLARPDGQIGHVIAHYFPAFVEGAYDGFFVLVTDITEIKQREAALQIANSVFQNTVEAIVVSDGAGAILSVNPAFTKITGYSAAEAVGQTRALFTAEQHGSTFVSAAQSVSETHQPWRGDIWMRRKNGERFLASKTVSELFDTAVGEKRFLSVFNDATELVLSNERLRRLALYDDLTDLPNRYSLLERLQHLCDLSGREERLTAVLFIDLDRFKTVNDSLGHRAGDLVLIEVASRLHALVRQTDTVARLGGDEFVVLLSNPESPARVVQVARRILEALATPLEVLGQLVEIGGSIGIVLGPADGDTPTALLEKADDAMYRAKTAGRGTYRFHDAETDMVRLRGDAACKSWKASR